jgi:CrcB protein
MSRRPPDAPIAAAVFLGGILGTLARAGVAEALPAGGPDVPWATLLVNLAGAALLGWAAVALTGHQLRRHLVATGLCGALTTFSTFQLELYRMVDDGRLGRALLYAGASLAAGLAAAVAGRRLAH